MAYIDYIHCSECDCKLLYDGDDNGCERLRLYWGKGHEADQDWAMKHALLCPECIAKLRAECERLLKLAIQI